MKTISILTSLLISSSAFAGLVDGHDRGNGGDALVCKNAQGQITSAHFFDLYEATEKFGMTLVPPKGATLEEKVLSLIDRVSSVDPIRAKLMKLWYKTFNKESSLKPGITLVDVPDTGDAFWPKECELAQLVVQTDLDLPLNPYRYLFSKDIWQLLDDNNKAATIVHELLWREARVAKHRTSAAIRYFNGLFLSDGFKNLTHDEYQELIEKLDLIIQTTKDGYPVGSAELYEGLEFSAGPARYKVLKTKADDRYTYTDFEVSEGNAVATIRPDFLLRPVAAPSTIEQIKITGVKVISGSLYLTGEFALTSARARFSTLTYSTEDQSWTLSNRANEMHSNLDGLVIKMNRKNEIKVSMMAEGTNGIDNIISYQLTQDGRKVKSITSNIEQRFVSVYSAIDEVVVSCKAMVPMEFQNSILGHSLSSCVLSKDTVVKNREEKNVRVRAGQRIYMDHAFNLIKVQ
ncbi:hypothetical protein D3C72_1106850 [compost metagenome]